MGDAAEQLQLLLSGMVARDVLEGLHVDDLFNCARYNALWEEAVLPLLATRLRFFALLQDRLEDPFTHSKFLEELHSRLAIAEKASKHPSFAMILCAEKHYEFRRIVLQSMMDVQCPVTAQRCGIKERRDASVCVLVFYGSPGATFECEWSPYAACGTPLAPAGLFDQLKRTIPLCGGEDVYRHRNTGLPARFALYITNAFDRAAMFRRQPSLFDEDELKAPVVEAICAAFEGAALVMGTACSLALDANLCAFDIKPTGDVQISLCLQTPVVVLVLVIR
ncbi:hypothetical protein HPB49_022281 [Dermacentor silvarum]|uniref:Uncharacterized protein n=1 Tax=Dermacentor silvarum TaxID=543639 RepID=A0ACB8CBR7_DERSI|nr:hypothetical protein HPB49_022281 [Dermacentor silvarum]